MDSFIQHGMDVGFGVLSALLLGACGIFTRQLAIIRKEKRGLRFGLQALLRDRIVQEYLNYSEQGFCPVDRQQTIEELYAAYTSLDGNGTVAAIVEKLRTLPPTSLQK